MTRAERRLILKSLKKQRDIKLTNAELFCLYEENIKRGKEENLRFRQNAESINSEIEADRAYRTYEHLVEFYGGNKERAEADYKKMLNKK